MCYPIKTISGPALPVALPVAPPAAAAVVSDSDSDSDSDEGVIEIAQPQVPRHQ